MDGFEVHREKPIVGELDDEKVMADVKMMKTTMKRLFY